MYVALLLLKSDPTVPSFLYHSFSRLEWVWVWFLVESCSSSSGELRSDIRQRCWSLRSLPRLKGAIAVIDEIDSSVLMATIAEQSGGGTTMLVDYGCELSYACKLHVENSRSSSNGRNTRLTRFFSSSSVLSASLDFGLVLGWTYLFGTQRSAKISSLFEFLDFSVYLLRTQRSATFTPGQYVQWPNGPCYAQIDILACVSFCVS